MKLELDFEKEFDMKFMISLRIMADSYVVLMKFHDLNADRVSFVYDLLRF